MSLAGPRLAKDSRIILGFAFLQVYYELDDERKKVGSSDVAICRVEEFVLSHMISFSGVKWLLYNFEAHVLLLSGGFVVLRTSLKTLKLLDCYKVGDESVSSLAQFCKNLETLIIGGCRDISDESIILLADSCRDGLKNLRMDWCLNATDSSLTCVQASWKEMGFGAC
ncbi:hypothetical protein Bca52824_059274 [Brassica carinata]|uniref:Uncharacterized protein n=1 Tax=Brassica carinata TaxID=52824 RepID=A0A8X7UFI9_BRACI|nr:hypothetical protein Bca52824_059274 [Brassica carinata]